jgi:hypothetical protein
MNTASLFGEEVLLNRLQFEQRRLLMEPKDDYRIVAVEQFVEATRDSGYKDFAAALAELVDNALEAGATEISIDLVEDTNVPERPLTVCVLDNGKGMSPSVLRLALQFGGSTRFNSRAGIGRYGMGLPNSSLSQTRRADVYTWRSPGVVWWSYLDVDEIASGRSVNVPKPKRRLPPKSRLASRTQSGTLVLWKSCDRVQSGSVKSISAKLHERLGRTFRKTLRQGTSINVNGEAVLPIDPLFLRRGNNLVGGTLYGPALKYRIEVPESDGKRVSTVTIKFAELPVEKWHRLSNEEKRLHRISKRAGVSILRCGREVDYGWFFMGAKRKENYDDWWRVEIQFDAELDELFGVTHTKQGIRPTAALVSMLSPDVERIAHELNARVRRQFISVKEGANNSSAEKIAGERDYLLEPPKAPPSRRPSPEDSAMRKDPGIGRGSLLPGFKYRIEAKALKDVSFFIPVVSGPEVLILLNEQHPFYERIYSQAIAHGDFEKKQFLQALQLLILSAARAECSVDSKSGRKHASSLRHSWSNVLAAFLG